MSIAQHLRVVIADDTSTSRMLLRDALEQLGIRQISSAADGEEALKSVMDKLPHLVISDFNMPKLDGLGLLKAVRIYQPTRSTPFIILTGRGDRSLVERAVELRVNNYLTKPFTVPALKTAIEAVIGRLR